MSETNSNDRNTEFNPGSGESADTAGQNTVLGQSGEYPSPYGASPQDHGQYSNAPQTYDNGQYYPQNPNGSDGQQYYGQNGDYNSGQQYYAQNTDLNNGQQYYAQNTDFNNGQQYYNQNSGYGSGQQYYGQNTGAPNGQPYYGQQPDYNSYGANAGYNGGQYGGYGPNAGYNGGQYGGYGSNTGYNNGQYNGYNPNGGQQYYGGGPYANPQAAGRQAQPAAQPVSNIFYYILMALTAISTIATIAVVISMLQSLFDGSIVSSLESGSLSGDGYASMYAFLLDIMANTPAYSIYSVFNSIFRFGIIIVSIIDIVQVRQKGYPILGMVLFTIFFRPGYFIWRAHATKQKQLVPVLFTIFYVFLYVVYFVWCFSLAFRYI